MEESLTQLGLGGLVAIMVIREVLSFLSRKSNSFTMEDRHQLRDLHQWHSLTDDEGVKVWYVRRSLEEAVVRLADSIEKFGEAQRSERDVLKEIARDMRDMRKAQQK